MTVSKPSRPTLKRRKLILSNVSFLNDGGNRFQDVIAGSHAPVCSRLYARV
jgi:hypothetical protein